MLGTVAAIGAYFLGAQRRHPRGCWPSSYAGFFLNLVNLIPLPPLDGGRITAVLSPRIWLLGVPIIGTLLWFHFSCDPAAGRDPRRPARVDGAALQQGRPRVTASTSR